MKQKPVEGLVHEELARSFSVVESFGLVRVRSSEDDKGHVIASITGAPTVVIAIEDVEGVAGGQSGAAIVAFRITHGQEMGGVNGHEELEVNLFCRKLVGELCEEMLKRTTRA